MTITLERLQHSDINLLRELRNANRDSFFDSRVISPNDQEQWWRRYSANPSGHFYTIWLNKVTPVGFLSVHCLRIIRYFPHGVSHLQNGITKWFDICEIGNLLLAPAHRGRGIMAEALTEVRRLYSPLTFWIAHVKVGNTASLRLFERAGFFHVPRKYNRKPKKSCPPLTASDWNDATKRHITLKTVDAIFFKERK